MVTITFGQEYGYQYSNQYSYSNNNQNYQSNTGTQYQYDMSNPHDRVQYSTDTNAQMRDQMNVNPYRSIDRAMGQYGGGINDN